MFINYFLISDNQILILEEWNDNSLLFMFTSYTIHNTQFLYICLELGTHHSFSKGESG